MADRWWGALEIENAPAEWTREVTLTAHDGSPYAMLELATDAMPEDVREAIEYLGDFEEIDRDEDGALRLTDGQLAGGSYAFHEHGLLDALKNAGVAFSAYDDGDYGNPGVYYFWRPSLEDIQERTYAAETGVVIDAGRLRGIFAKANFAPAEHPELAQALRNYFDLTPDDTLLYERVEDPT